MLRKIILAAVSLTMLVLVSGCNTVDGVGKDISAGGDAISKSAQ